MAMNMLTDPRIAPFTEQKAVADSVIETFAPMLSEGDPDKFKKQGNDLLNSAMGGVSPPPMNTGLDKVVPSPMNLASSVGMQ